jgi:urease accessory protein UreF
MQLVYQEGDDHDDDDDCRRKKEILHGMQQQIAGAGDGAFVSVGHMAPVFGVVARLLNVDDMHDACRLFGYCVARDLVSASVRLNLVGPMAGQRVLADTHHAVERALGSRSPDSDLLPPAGCAPVVEAVHACHDILRARLFRS